MGLWPLDRCGRERKRIRPYRLKKRPELSVSRWTTTCETRVREHVFSHGGHKDPYFAPVTRLLRMSVALLCGLTLYAASHGDWTRQTPHFLGFVVSGLVTSASWPASASCWLCHSLWKRRFGVSAAAAFTFTLTAPLAYLVYPAWTSEGASYVSWWVRGAEYGVPLLAAIAVRAWSEAEGR